MPNQPKTPQRTIRIPDDLWNAVQEKCKENGEDATKVALRAYKRYVKAAK